MPHLWLPRSKTREGNNNVQGGGREKRAFAKKVTFDVGPPALSRYKTGTDRCSNVNRCGNVTQLSSSGQHKSVHEGSVRELKHHVRQAQTAEGQLKQWHIRQAQRQVANMLIYQSRLTAPSIAIDACCGTGTSVALYYLKYTDALVIGIDRDKDKDYVLRFIPTKYHHRFIFIKDDVKNITVKRLRQALPPGSRMQDIVHFHSSPPCESMSRADRYSTHRDGIQPISEQAIADDEALEYTVKLSLEIIKESPSALISLENPCNDVFPYLPGVRELLKDKRWQMLTASYCACANHLDIGYWPQKDSNFLVYGVPRGFSLPMCNNDCSHLVPGTARHRVVLCNNSRNDPRQFVLKDRMIKGVIPHGLLGRLWEAHRQLIEMWATAATRLRGSVRPTLIDARAVQRETERSVQERVAAYGASQEELREGLQQTASKLVHIASGETREFRSQVTFAQPLVTRVQTVRNDVERGIPNLRQLVAKNRQEVRSQRRQAVALPVTTRSAKDAELPVEEADAADEDEVTEAPDCVPLLPVEASTGEIDIVPVDLDPVQLRPSVPEKEAPPGNVVPWARFIAGVKPGIMVDYDKLRPSELLFADEIEFEQFKVKGKKQSMLLVYDAMTGGIRVKAENSKREHGDRFRELAIQEAWNKRGHKVTVSSDGCGSMTYLRDSALDLGIDHWPIPPYSPRFNLAEQAIGSFKATVTACLLGASADKGPIDASYVQYAAEYVAYMHERFVQKRRHRDQLVSPYEINIGVKPRLDRAVPFGTAGYAFVNPDVRKARGWSKSVRSEPVLMLGYQHMYSRTYKCLTAHGSVIHVDKVRWCPQEPLGVFLQWRKDLNSGAKYHLALDPFDTEDGSPEKATDAAGPAATDVEGAGKKEAPGEETERAGEKEAQDSATSSTTAPTLPSVSIGKPTHKVRVSLKGDLPAEPQFLRIVKNDLKSSGLAYIRDRTLALSEQCVADVIGRHFSDGKGGTKRYNWSDLSYDLGCGWIVLEISPTDISKDGLRKVCTPQVFMCAARAFITQGPTENRDQRPMTPEQGVVTLMAHIAMKDLPWKRYLEGPEKKEVITAHEKELDALLTTKLTDTKGVERAVLEELAEDHPEFAFASGNKQDGRPQATSCREILEYKRSGVWKARVVIQGFKEDKEELDGPGFIYSSNVVGLAAVRRAMLGGRRPGHSTMQVDISTAFLQSDLFSPDDPPRYLMLKDPVTKGRRYFRQWGVVYGSCSAPRRWQDTLHPWIESQGFVAGKNEPCVFYNKSTGVLVETYVDDCLGEGPTAETEKFMTALAVRFKCKPPVRFGIGSPIDHLGMTFFETEQGVYLTMENYVDAMMVKLDLEPSNFRRVRSPISAEIKDDVPCCKTEATLFMMGTGMLGWLAFTGRPDLKYAHSRISQHMAKPTRGALAALHHCLRYCWFTKNLCLHQPAGKGLHPDEWEFSCDSDQSGNTEENNNRRSQMGLLARLGSAPIVWGSKASAVHFDEPQTMNPEARAVVDLVAGGTPVCNADMTDLHPDMSSAAAEIYASSIALAEFLHITYVNEEMGFGRIKPINILVDNSTAIAFAKCASKRSKLRHIDCRQRWVQALRDRTICDLVKVGTDDNLSDIFTKILGPNKFESLRDRMMVACNMPTPEELKAASAVPPTASVRRSTRRKRRPGHQTGS